MMLIRLLGEIGKIGGEVGTASNQEPKFLSMV